MKNCASCSIKEKDINNLKKRFVLSFVFGLPLMYVAMGGMVGLPIPELLEKYNIGIQFVLSTIVILVSLIFHRLTLLPDPGN